jgi:Fe-S-cluster containining protein
MPSQEEQIHDLAKTTNLCLSCGFCCQGLIFGRAALRSDELAVAVEYGLPYFAIDKCDYGFVLPCHLYQNGRCLIYSNRPHACRRYRCHLLKRLATGEICLENGLLIVDQANRLKDSINEKIANFENGRNFRQSVNIFLDLYCKNPMAFGGSGDKILREVESFYAMLHQYFEQRAV